MYTVFIRCWYKWSAPDRYTGRRHLEPHPRARRTILGYASTETEARQMCAEYNDNNKPGPLSRKAEYTRDF